MSSRLAPAQVEAVIPPSCRRGVGSPTATRPEGHDAIIEMPECVPRRPVRHLLPSLSLLTVEDYSFRFEVTAEVGGEWTPWVASATIGAHAFGAGSMAAALRSDVDVFLGDAPIERARLRVRLHPASAAANPWLVTLSACDLLPDGVGPRERTAPASLPVPAWSQMEEALALRERICSPTCVAMVLGYWGRPASVVDVAAETFHPGLDLYGVWPAAIRAGARRRLPGYLLRFPDFDAALWCLAQRLPIIASVRYDEGELAGAAVSKTSGHLIVLRGLDGDFALVNDPAAATRAAVPRRYRMDELARVWLERTGVGYVFFDPAPGTVRGA